MFYEPIINEVANIRDFYFFIDKRSDGLFEKTPFVNLTKVCSAVALMVYIVK